MQILEFEPRICIKRPPPPANKRRLSIKRPPLTTKKKISAQGYYSRKYGIYESY